MSGLVRRPRQVTIGGFDVLYVEGASAPWRVVARDRPEAGSLAHCRRRCDAAAAVTSGAAARTLAGRLTERAAS